MTDAWTRRTVGAVRRATSKGLAATSSSSQGGKVREQHEWTKDSFRPW